MHRIQVYKGTTFCCLKFCRRKCYNICYFHIKGVFFPTSYFQSERDPDVEKIVSHILRSLFYHKLVKIVSSDKRQSHIGYTFSSCLVITNSTLIEKVVYLSIFLKIWISNLIFSYEFNTFQWHFIISAKVNYSVSFYKYFIFRNSLFTLLLSN